MLLLIAATHRRMARLSWTHCCLQTDIVYDWEWAVVIWILLVGVCVLCVLGTGTHPACATMTWNRYTSWVCHYDVEPVHPICATITWNRYTSWVCHYDMEPVHPICATITWKQYILRVPLWHGTGTSYVYHYNMEPVHILGVPLWRGTGTHPACATMTWNRYILCVPL